MASFLDMLLGGVESNGDPKAKNPKSSASGAFQITDQTWQALGNPGHASDAPPEIQRGQAERLAAQNEAALAHYGIPVDDSTRYLAWQQGPAGARALLSNPEKNAVQALIDIGVSPEKARQSVVNNGGTVDMTAGQFAQHVQGMAKGGGMPDTTTSGMDIGQTNSMLQKLLQGDPAYQGVLKAQGADTEARKQAMGALDQEGAALQGVRDKYAQIKSPTAPEAPQLPGEQGYKDKELGAVSKQPMDPTRVMGQFLPMLAILGGAFTKNGAIGSLKAAGAAMTAAKQNDKDAIERAHQQWMDDTTQLTNQYKLEQDSFNDTISKNGEDRANLLADMNVLAAQYNIPILKEQIAAGDLDGAYKTIQSRSAALSPMIELQQNAIANDFRRQQLVMEEGKIPPATKAYNDAYQDALKAGKSPEEARSAAVGAVKEISLALHPTAASQIGLREEKNLESDPVIKAARTNQQYISNIENVTPEDLNTGAGQVRLIDSFTRLATNQAIRGFMVKNAEQYQGLAGRASLFMQQNNIDPDSPPAAPFLDKAQINAYLEQGKKMVEEIRQAEGKQLAQHAENMEARGVDPSQGGLNGDDLELAMTAGYKPDPKKWGLSSAEAQPSTPDLSAGGDAADTTPQTLPSKKTDLVAGTVYQTAHGPATWDGTQFEALQ